MQLEIYTPTEGQPLPPVEWNYEAIKTWLEDGLSAYKGRVYTEDTIKDAKKDAASLRKLSAAIDGKRKEMKARYLEPYSKFESQAKELTGMIDTQVAEIAAQINGFEDARKAEKLEHIKTLYADIMGDLAPLVPYERLHNPKWLNVTYSANTIEAELIEKAEIIRAALNSIDALGLPDDIEQQVKSKYLTTLDLAAALSEKDRIERERQKLAEYEARKQQKALEPEQPQEERPAEIPDYAQIQPPRQAPALNVVDFRVWATSEQLNALKTFLTANGIRYGKVPNYR